ncbi:DUF1304 domain-containing protein [Lactococcus nasutitermitis]|uniref:DUF1304 domain-containing protein n=1 Tax=Lactococcus nasutitermitis TaxID=1652957 RepID=A0ABV9JD54_9LACT|nr:DUF1304 domain-containing protein [Lactococcus nasutitermitis]
MLLIIFSLIIAVEHLLFGIVEMFGKAELQSKAFGFPVAELKNKNLRLALANQGIYNLSLGVLIALVALLDFPVIVTILLMGFVVVVGIYGGATVTRTIWLVQALPALIVAIVALFFV